MGCREVSINVLDALRSYSLSEYRWDDDRNYYVYPSSGRKVSQRELFLAIYRHNTKVNSDLQSTLTRYLQGDFDLKTWQDRTGEKIRANHNTLMEFGRGGKGKATANDYKIIEKYLKSVEYTALLRFTNAIREGNLSEAQIKHRLSLYAYHSKVSYEEGVRLSKKKQKVKKARRRLGNCKNHCADCLAYAALGWVSIADLILPGDACACNSYCQCSVEYED